MAYDKYEGLVHGNVSFDDVGEALGIASRDESTLCSSNAINPMAKYKPVRFAKINDLTEVNRKNRFYGFCDENGYANSYSFNSGNADGGPTWTYYGVRAGTDWARITDFDGYFHYACAPFAFEVSGALEDGVGFQMFVDSMAGTHYSQKGYTDRWGGDYNLTIDDLFGQATSVNKNATLNSYVAFVIHDIDNGDHILVVTSVKLGDISSTVPTIILYAQQMTINGVTYPGVPMLNDNTRSGHTFRFVACLTNSGPQNPTAYGYEIRTGDLSNVYVYSLAMKEGIDKIDMVLTSTHSIMGLECSLYGSGLVLTYVSEDSTFYKYELTGSLYGEFVTPSGHWSADYVGAMITVSSEYGYVGEDPVIHNVTRDCAVDIPNNNTTYNLLLWQISGVYVYIFKGVPVNEHTAKISGFTDRLSEKVYFDNVLTVRVATS